MDCLHRRCPCRESYPCRNRFDVLWPYSQGNSTALRWCAGDASAPLKFLKRRCWISADRDRDGGACQLLLWQNGSYWCLCLFCPNRTAFCWSPCLCSRSTWGCRLHCPCRRSAAECWKPCCRLRWPSDRQGLWCWALSLHAESLSRRMTAHQAPTCGKNCSPRWSGHVSVPCAVCLNQAGGRFQ